MRVPHILGSRCRACGYLNETDDEFLACVPRGLRCAGCGLSVPSPPAITDPGVDPFAQVRRHFEAIVWHEDVRG